jgi:hypothetical protein
MDEAEAMQLVQYGEYVTIFRNGQPLEDVRVVGYVDRPALILQDADGKRTVVPIDRAECKWPPD